MTETWFQTPVHRQSEFSAGSPRIPADCGTFCRSRLDYEITGGGVTKYVKVEGLGAVAKRVGTGGSGQTFWHHTDRLGSIQAITDGSGALVQRRTYRPYGEKIADSARRIRRVDRGTKRPRDGAAVPAREVLRLGTLPEIR